MSATADTTSINVFINEDFYSTSWEERSQWSMHFKLMVDDALRAHQLSSTLSVAFRPEPPLHVTVTTYRPLPFDEEDHGLQAFYKSSVLVGLSPTIFPTPGTAAPGLSLAQRADPASEKQREAAVKRQKTFNERIFKALSQNTIDFAGLDFESLACFALALHQFYIPLNDDQWVKQIHELNHPTTPKMLFPHRIFRLCQLATVVTKHSSALESITKSQIKQSLPYLGARLEVIFQLAKLFEYYPRYYSSFHVITTENLAMCHDNSMHGRIVDLVNGIVKRFHRLKATPNFTCLSHPDIVEFFNKEFQTMPVGPLPKSSTLQGLRKSSLGGLSDSPRANGSASPTSPHK